MSRGKHVIHLHFIISVFHKSSQCNSSSVHQRTSSTTARHTVASLARVGHGPKTFYFSVEMTPSEVMNTIFSFSA